MSLKRSGLYPVMGRRSSMGWMPVALGLYSLRRIATSTPSPSMYSSRRSGTSVPSSSYRSERGMSFPKCSAHSIQEDFSVGRRAACTCASISDTPSSITSLLWRLQRRNKPLAYYIPRVRRANQRRSIYSLPQVPLPLHVPEPKLSVLVRGGSDPLRRAPVESLLDLGRCARRQDFGWDLPTFAHHAPRSQHGPPSYACPVEDDAPHADERLILYDAPVQHREVPNGDVGADERRLTLVRVQYRIVLDVAARSHNYPAEVCPQNGSEPDASPFFDDHVSDKHRGWGYEGIGGDLRLFTVERKEVCHGCPPPLLNEFILLLGWF